MNRRGLDKVAGERGGITAPRIFQDHGKYEERRFWDFQV